MEDCWLCRWPDATIEAALEADAQAREMAGSRDGMTPFLEN
jgi:hypothetical protein